MDNNYNEQLDIIIRPSITLKKKNNNNSFKKSLFHNIKKKSFKKMVTIDTIKKMQTETMNFIKN